MNYISDVLYWISTGLLVPVIVLLIVFFQFFLNLLGNQRSFELCVYVIHFHQPPAV